MVDLKTPRQSLSNTERKRLLQAKISSQPAAGTRSAFREVEKLYLSRNPPPDYSQVLDFRNPQDICGVTSRAISLDLLDSRGTLAASDADYRNLHALTLESHPGLIIIPNALSPERQRTFIRQCMRETIRPPNINNLDTHYQLPAEGLWNLYERHLNDPVNSPDRIIATKAEQKTTSIDSDTPLNSRRLINNPAMSADVNLEALKQSQTEASPSSSVPPMPVSQLLYKLRWTNLGLLYHWTSKSYVFDEVLEKGRGAMIPVPEDLAMVSRKILQAIPRELVPQGQDWSTFAPESGIINFYQLKNTLMGHIDQSELVENQPLVSLSFGHSAVFLIGGHTRDEKPNAIYVHSGDILIMSGQCRRAYHGVPRILENSLPDYLSRTSDWKSDSEDNADWNHFADYLSTTRINVNIRQVFPPDFFSSTNT